MRPTPEKLLSAIHAYCLQCSGNSRKEVERCSLRRCPLYGYRSNKAEEQNSGRVCSLPGQMTIADALAAGEERDACAYDH